MLHTEIYKEKSPKPLPDQARLLGDLLPSKSNEHGWTRAVFDILLQKLNSRPRLYRLLSEFRSFLHRIGIVWRSSEPYRTPLGYLWLESPNGRAYKNKRSLARSESIQSFSSTYPWATPLDWRLHREAWDAGVEWAFCTLSSDKLSTDEKSLLVSELSYSVD